MVIIFPVFAQPVAALTTNDLQSILHETPFYDPSVTCSTTVGSGSGGGDSAGTALTQAGLDPQWVNLIVNSAHKYGTDPIAMAAILYWENRGWPAYKTTGWSDNPSSGMGPWQFIQTTWQTNFVPPYTMAQVDDPVASTDAAAQFINGFGAVAGIPDGSIDQDFSKGSKIASMATLMKDYNAGGATYRTPGVAQHDQAGRIWYDGNGSNWANISPSKPQIIDDYIVAGTYLYYQISSGQTVTYNDTASYVAEALKNQDQVKGYTFGGSTGGQVSGGCVAGGCSNNGTGAGGGNTVVLDPGHAGANTEQVDPTTGIETLESGGAPGEMQNMWDTAQLIKTKLEAAGYSVVLTKNSEDDTAGFVTKVARANSANAAIAVSLHYTDGTFGVANDHYGVTPQVVGEFRQNNDNGKRATFTDTALDQKSAQYAQAIAAARNATGDTTKVDNLDNSFPPNRPDILAYGNIPIVELLGKVPWVYNEVGDQGFDMQKYATGITNGIMAAVPLSGNQTTSTATGSTTSCGAVAGSVVQTAMNYAWPDFKGNPFCDEEPAYKTAIDTAKANGQYTGAPCDTDSTLAGIDCGAFVTRVMIDSNADPGYNDSGKGGNTIPQEAYLKAQTAAGKYQLITPTTTDDLLAGDIAIVNNASREHTYLYVGETSSHPSFHGNAASASQGTRAPMADGVGTGDLTTFSWYRLIK